MRQIVPITVAAVLGLTVTGCDFSNLFGGSTTSSSPVAVSPVPAGNLSPGNSPTGQAANPTFPKPTVEQKNMPKGILPADLISSTDPNQRVRQVKGDRSDPFALLPTTPTVQLAPGATSTSPNITPAPTGGRSNGSGSPNSSGSPATRGGGTSTSQTRTTAPSTAALPRFSPAGGSGSSARTTASNSRRPTTIASKPAAKPPTSPIAANPPRPQPVLAQAVAVSGIVQIGDQVFAIVDAPNEPSSRYVQAGQRLAGGQVLVRKIDANRAEPVVILEQNGVEVSRAVGESAPATKPPAT